MECNLESKMRNPGSEKCNSKSKQCYSTGNAIRILQCVSIISGGLAIRHDVNFQYYCIRHVYPYSLKISFYQLKYISREYMAWINATLHFKVLLYVQRIERRSRQQVFH